VRKMLSAFPDYGKSPPEYLLTMTELVASYPEHIQRQVCDVKTGVASKEDFLPNSKKVTDFAERLLADEAKFAAYGEVRKRFTINERSVGRSYHCPFRNLEMALAETMETDLLVGRNFDEMFAASRALATEGKQAARDMLWKMANPNARQAA
jgi:hypothetical protein